MNKIIKFGEELPQYNIPILNEREVRAAAGILFILMFVSVQLVIFNNNFTLLKYAVTIFLTDFVIRVFVNPKFSPTLIIARLIVSNQVPEYVGAAQKKFAWIIGVILASIMFILLVIINGYSMVSGIICFTCLIFLFFESAFGICIGCKLYSMVYKEKAKHCPGEVCESKLKHYAQNTSLEQLLVVSAFIIFIILIAYFFNDTFSHGPYKLF